MTLKAAADLFSSKFELRRDPITGRLVCYKCWNQVHGTERAPRCQHLACACLCKDRKGRAGPVISFR